MGHVWTPAAVQQGVKGSHMCTSCVTATMIWAGTIHLIWRVGQSVSLTTFWRVCIDPASPSIASRWQNAALSVKVVGQPAEPLCGVPHLAVVVAEVALVMLASMNLSLGYSVAVVKH